MTLSLSASYNYLFLDFETTGLDVTVDFPTQIGLIEINHEYKIERSYSSYIDLPEDFGELDGTISYITGIDRKKLKEQGQSIEKITEDVSGFFGENTIIIGQNISFDLGFLKKFFPQCQWRESINIYPLIASSLPYLGSYSLETVDHHLSTKFEDYAFLKDEYLHTISGISSLSAHDALYDCVVGLSFLTRFTNQLSQMSVNYPIILQHIYAIRASEGFSFFHLVEGSSTPIVHEKKALPVLSAPLKQSQKTNPSQSLDRSKIPSESKFSTAGVDLATLITELPRKSIIAVSHASKMDIIKQANPHITFGHLKAEQTLDHKRFHAWLYEKKLSSEEVLFAIFYLSHFRDGYRVLHPVLDLHKYILDYLQVLDAPTLSSDYIICTLGGLYYTLEQPSRRQQEFADYTICILDADWRHLSYNNFSQKGINLSSTLFQREKLQYTLNQSQDIGKQKLFGQLVDDWITFVAYFGIESNRFLGEIIGTEISFLIDHSDYPQTNHLWKALKDHWKAFVRKYGNYEDITALIAKLDKLFQSPLMIKRQQGRDGDTSYIVSPSVRYIDFAEYLKLFGNQKILFFSPNRKEYRGGLPLASTHRSLSISELSSIESCVRTIQGESDSVFIISHSHEKSKKIFGELQDRGFGTSRQLMGEYITGGIGKVVSQYHDNKSNIIIGGYHLLLQLRANKKLCNRIIIYSLPKALQDIVPGDSQFYAFQKRK